MNIFRLSWWLTPFIGLKWVRARDLAIASNYEACLSKLNSISRMRGKKLRPMGQWSSEFYILQGHSYFVLGNKDQSMECFRNAFRELIRPNDYSDDDKSYLSAYITTCHECFDLEPAYQVAIDEIDLDSVNRDIQFYFPLPTHPNWERLIEREDQLEV